LIPDRKVALPAFELIESILGDLFTGIGKPEPLKLPKGLRPLKSPAQGHVTLLQSLENLRDEFSDLGAKSLKNVLVGFAARAESLRNIAWCIA